MTTSSIIISTICAEFDGEMFEKLPKQFINLFIQYSYTCLFYKQGNQTLARSILVHTGEIQSSMFTGHLYTLYKKNDRLLSPYESLKRMGVTTVKVLEEDEINQYRTDFTNTMITFPEYKRSEINPNLDSKGNPMVYVLGGFGALGNPGSFNNPFVRNLRLRIKKCVIPLFKEVIENIPGTLNFEMLVDRMMFRTESQAPSAEAWHRDVVPPEKIDDVDEIYGGWINLDTKSQFFSYIPGSHLGVSLKLLKKGFSTIPKDHIPHICSENKQLYEILPGHIVIFPQYIIHEVVSKKADRDMMRLFTGWRTTTSKKFLHTDMRERFKTQAIIPLPSGQLPPMYSANHISFLKNKPFKPIPKNDVKVTVETWSHDVIKDVFIHDKVVQRFMNSLEKSGVQMYDPYTESEIEEYLPKPLVF